jgi:hypothetical protein
MIIAPRKEESVHEKWFLPWLFTWSIGGGVAVTILVKMLAFEGFLVWLVGWCLGEFWALYSVTKKYLSRHEYLLISEHAMTIGKAMLGIRRKKTYQLNKIQDLRLTSERNIGQEYLRFSQERILFDYEMHTIRFGKYLEQSDARTFLKLLTDMLSFRCQSVEHIIFGTQCISEEARLTTLQNPDVSTLTFPFMLLKQIVIETDTYQFYQIEHFLTYAINYIGQDYLKTKVDVHVYGDIENLHPNIRNNLTNLCKCVHVFGKDEFLFQEVDVCDRKASISSDK